MTDRGYSLVELLLVVALIVVTSIATAPLALTGLERARVEGAARYLSTRLMLARYEAIKRSTFVAVRFANTPDGYSFGTFADGNSNGVLSLDIEAGVDRRIGVEERLEWHFTGVAFGIRPGVTGVVPGEAFDTSDPIQMGRSTLLSFSPDGSSTSGTLYVRGARSTQYAVRVLGATARCRTLRFDFGTGLWLSR